MAEITARVYREKEGFRSVVDGWGSFGGRTLAEAILATKRGLEQVVTGAFPDRPVVDPQGAQLVVRYRIELSPLGAREACGPGSQRPACERRSTD